MDNIETEKQIPDITFSLNNTNYKDIMKITADGKFLWKGKEVEDTQKIYEKVCAFFNVADVMDK